jgi:ketosteroid isomerase-like protein
MKRESTLFLVISLLGILGCGTTHHYSNTDEGLIRQARLNSNQGIASKDTNTIARYWAEDYHLVSSRNSEVAGLAKNRHLFATELYSKKEVLYVRTTQQVAVFSNWNMAAENGTWTGQWREADGLVQLKGTYYAKWHKVDGDWKIRAEIFVPLSCTGSVFCDKKPF